MRTAKALQMVLGTSQVAAAVVELREIFKAILALSWMTC